MGSRGVLTSFGAGVSLVVFGLLMLVTVSSVIAFEGWPKSDPLDSVGAVQVATIPDEPESSRTFDVTLGAGNTVAAAGRRAAGTAPGPARPSASRGAAARDADSRRPAPATVAAERASGSSSVSAGTTTSTAAPVATPAPSEPTGTPSSADNVAATVKNVTDLLRPGRDADQPIVELPRIKEVSALDPVVETVNNTTAIVQGVVKDVLDGGR